MSDLDTRPAELVGTATGADGPEELLLTSRKVWLGKTTEVARALPDRQIRMIGAWCFLDHYGPQDVAEEPGMRVWAHPHTGLQTVTWLLEGEVEHRDSLGTRLMVRPGELNIMTAGRGIVHSELSLADKPPTLHGVQLWIALPDFDRDMAPRFENYAELPVVQVPGVTGPGLTGSVLLGEVAGVRSPAGAHSPLAGADLTLAPGASVEVPLNPTFEYGVLLIRGEATVATTKVGVDQLLYLGLGRDAVQMSSRDGARLILVGGLPFEEEIVMWWNFIGRSHEEVARYREAWERRDVRFPAIVTRDEKVMEAPTMPTVPLKPRSRRARQP